MVVLSLFDGMSCGQIAFERCGIKVSKYFASEIKSHAIKVTKHNYPDTIHVGDVTKIHYKDGVLITENGSFEIKIDIVIGGSPCQDLSNMNMNQSGLEGEKSRLFWEYVRIRKETKAQFFFLENVASAPVKDKAIINKTMGVQGVRINSSLVSAQLRDRIYWTNIHGSGKDIFGKPCIEQPKDKHIYLKDILESGTTLQAKAYCLTRRQGGAVGIKDKIKLSEYIDRRCSKGGFVSRIIEGDLNRLFTQRELERLQTVDEGYTECLPYNQASDVLGDGWTIDVVCHIFQGLKTVIDYE